MAKPPDSSVLRLAARITELEEQVAGLGSMAAELLEDISRRSMIELGTEPTIEHVLDAKRALAWMAKERDALITILDRERDATQDEIALEWKTARAAARAAGFDMSQCSLSDVVTTLGVSFAAMRTGLPN